MDWRVDDPFITRYLARPVAVKLFRQIFEISPPSKRDWLAMKVCQRVVSEKLKKLKEIRNALFEEENKRISAPLTPQGVQERIADNLELHARVEVAKTAYENAEWLVMFFRFDID